MKKQAKRGSKPYRRELRERLKGLGFADEKINEAIVAALTQVCHMRPRMARRLACEFSLDEVAARYNTIMNDAQSRMRGSRIWDYEQWPRRGVRPTAKTLRTLADIYGTTWVDLVDFEDLQHMPEEDREFYHRCAAGDPLPRAQITPDQQAEDNVSAIVRESTSSRGTSTTELIAQSAENALKLARQLTATNVDNMSLDQLERELLNISRAYLHASPYPVFLQLVKLHEHVAELLRGHQRSTQTRKLHALISQCSALMAWICDDLGDVVAARDLAWAAWLCASHAERADARRWVRVVRSRLAFSSGDFVESARLAGDGVNQGWSDGIESHLLLRSARAWARAGQEGQAREELRKWEGMKERLKNLGTGNGILHLQDAQQRYFIGATLLDIRDFQPALAELQLALELFDKTPADLRPYVEHSLSRIDSAKALLTAGEPQKADNIIAPVFGLQPERRVRTILSSLHELLAFAVKLPFIETCIKRDWSWRVEEFTSRAITRRCYRTPDAHLM